MTSRAAAPRVGAVVPVVVFAAAVIFTILQPWMARDVAVERFVAAVTAARRQIQAGDMLLVHPPWRDDVVNALRRGAVALPAGVDITEAFAPRHGDPWPSLVIVADTGWPLPAAIAARVQDDGVFVDGVRVVRIAGSAPRPTASSPTGSHVDLARAVVHVETADGARVPCPWSADRRRHVCTGLPEWMTVGDDTLFIGGRRERCTWAHPITGGALVIDFGSLSWSRPGAVTVGLALSDAAADNPAGAPVTATLVVDDAEVAVTAHRERGFHSATLPVLSKQARVQLRLTTPHDGQRHACFRLTTTEGP